MRVWRVCVCGVFDVGAQVPFGYDMDLLEVSEGVAWDVVDVSVFFNWWLGMAEGDESSPCTRSCGSMCVCDCAV